MPPLSCYLTVSSSTYFVWSPKDKCSWSYLPLEGGGVMPASEGAVHILGCHLSDRDSALGEKGMRGRVGSSL